MMPFHILEKIKQTIYPDDYKERNQKISYSLILPKYFDKVSKALDKKCTFNPISPQGMMIFGCITCVYALKQNKDVIEMIKSVLIPRR